MNVERVSLDEYKKNVKDSRIFFNEPVFCDLNKDKVEDIHYLIIKKGNSARFGLIIGQNNTLGQCPFSAPYSYPVPIKKETNVLDYDEGLEAIEEYCKSNGIDQIRFIFPPFFYDEDCLSAWMNSMYRCDFKVENMDINYMLNLKDLNSNDYESLITAKGRGHLRNAVKKGIKVMVCDTEDTMREAYEIILANHNAKNRPTHMSFEQLQETFKIVSHDVFVAKMDGKNIAGMINYHITGEIVQCIYGCHLLEYSNSGVMNYLFKYAVQYYGKKGFKILDWATATEGSVPNYGLCDFKESCGAKKGLKYTVYKDFKSF